MLMLGYACVGRPGLPVKHGVVNGREEMHVGLQRECAKVNLMCGLLIRTRSAIDGLPSRPSSSLGQRPVAALAHTYLRSWQTQPDPTQSKAKQR